MPLTAAEADALLEEFRSLLTRFTDRPSTPDTPTALPAPKTLAGYEVIGQEVLPDGFSYRWPKGADVTRYRENRIPTAQYRLRTREGEYSLLIGEEEGGRTTHGKAGRGRIVVFVRHGSNSMYPLVEFAETDEVGGGTVLYAAGIPRPDAPRSLATGEGLAALRDSVPHLREADVRRADEVYAGMRSGPSVRLTVPVNDVESMLVHALWVGQLRGGGRLPRPA